MSRLFAILISFQLIILPLPAMALPGSEEGADAAYLEDNFPVTSNGDEFRESSSGGKGVKSSALYMKQVLGLAIGVTGSTILMSCTPKPGTWSLYPFMAGSLGYIASELLKADEQAKFHTRKMSEIKMEMSKLKSGDVQKKSLEAARENELKNLDIIKKTKLMSMAITTTFLVATGLAIAEKYSKMTAIGLCSSSGTVTFGAGTMACIKGVIYVYDTGCKPGVATLSKKFINLGIMGAYSALSSSASSKSGSIASFVAPALSLVMLQTQAYDLAAFMMFGTPKNRIITFSSFTAVSGWITGGLIRRQKEIESNIKKLDDVIANYKDPAGQNSGIEEDDTSGETPEEKIDKSKMMKSKMAMLDKFEIKKRCIVQDGKNINITEKGDCSNSLKFPAPKFDINMKLGALQEGANLAADFGNSLARGDQAAAELHAVSLAKMASRIKKTNDELLAVVRKMPENDKESLKDIEKEISSNTAALSSNFEKLAKENNFTPPQDSPFDSEESTKSAPLLAAASPTMGDQMPSMPALDLSKVSEDSTETKVSDSAPQATLDDFESTVEDIAKTPDVSIFKQVSNRYILNYTKMFERRKEVEVPLEDKASAPAEN